jgi:hypothetical protein
LQRFESLLLTPATILGTRAEAGLNQKNSTSLTLGTQTAFDFYPPENVGGQAPRFSTRLKPKMFNGARKNLSNLALNFVTYLWDTSMLCHKQGLKSLAIDPIALTKEMVHGKDLHAPF